MKKNGLCTRKRPRGVEPVTVLSLWTRHRATNTNTNTTSTTRTTAPAILQHPQWKLLPGTITEIAGPAGVGKTQLALTMCADSVVLNQKAVYLLLGGTNMMGTLSYRLEMMLLARTNLLDKVQASRRTRRPFPISNFSSPPFNHATTNHDSTTTTAATTATTAGVTLEQIDQWLSNIFMQWIRNSEDLLDLLSTRLPKLLASHPPQSIRIIVLDGIAQLFRHNEDMSPGKKALIEYWQARSVTFFKVAGLCKQLSDQFQVPIVILNQATARINTTTATPPSPLTTILHNNNNNNRYNNNNADDLEPALGPSWKQCVNVSVFLTNTEMTFRPSHAPITVRKRLVTCLKAPNLPYQATLEFYIDKRGTVRICE